MPPVHQEPACLPLAFIAYRNAPYLGKTLEQVEGDTGMGAGYSTQRPSYHTRGQAQRGTRSKRTLIDVLERGMEQRASLPAAP